ncbi:MAG: ASCH domain-containing protein [Bacilli bacterium]
MNPEHVKNIINGTKKYEYRKLAAKQHISSIIIYETTPLKRIVAEVEVIDILMLSPTELWKETSTLSGVSKEFFNEYFKNRKVAFAYKLGKVKVYKKPKLLTDYGLKAVPQSFVYI